ncbi:bifunctional biotin--[acetyl-CoA-carboxylase] ligase/biotin operon repressor BirA [Glaciecola petra]|uniref:Bifunctional ligase/repressor BirA n=1 Tax=Glaciecola petra TaxID=3075602 RepID=A0ABU2ZVJ1_9ALTE|nr:bifunctional biotin--[acetyl-CoA-carboxylase] ligase/biotin operon repressor BirA [Aestuariibacter sp. P117]MDT0596668.1 bifunctional biotin--[acetyl-CoA-carboxylase] ligase/biotin operon repressor BirA [Aestuariibacter sp. P117]
MNKITSQQLRTELLNCLNDGNFHSGEALAEQFGLSRSAISNHIKALGHLGLEIFSVKGRGYQLATKIDLLSHNSICKGMQVEQASLVQVENIVSSTNDILKQQSQELSQEQSKNGMVCLAEAQTDGRGRRGRKWVSPYGASLYFSMLWQFDNGYQAMSGLSIMVGVVLNNTLAQFGVTSSRLKWPNDVYGNNKKLAGILIEVEGQADASVSAIIGIGLNLRLPNDLQGIDQAFTDLSDLLEKPFSRNELSKKLIENLWLALPVFEAQGLNPFIEDWDEADLYKNQEVVLISGDKRVKGVARGIDNSGALLLETDQKIKPYYGGEISVRPA